MYKCTCRIKNNTDKKPSAIIASVGMIIKSINMNTETVTQNNISRGKERRIFLTAF